MDGMPVRQTDENPVLSCPYLRGVCFATFLVIIVPVEEMRSALLEDRFHSDSTDTKSWVGHFGGGTELGDSCQIVEMHSFELHQLRRQPVILIGYSCFGKKSKFGFDAIVSINKKNFFGMRADLVLS